MELTISADFRFSVPDYVNDHIWELILGGGDPPALALSTTYGLRARSMRIFPRFTLDGISITDPAAFVRPVHLIRFQPNSLCVDFSPFNDIDVIAEYWVPDSHTVSGRFSISNQGSVSHSLFLDLCAQLIPLDLGGPMAPAPMQSVQVLEGRTSNLTPVIFLTGGPQPGPGPYASLSLNLILGPGASRTLTWAEAALSGPKESLELARLTAARPWEAEMARVELVNAGNSIEVFTGDPDWDAALALSQKTALRLFFGPSQALPYPSFVQSRRPDQGYSPRGDGSDYPPQWSGQSPLEAWYMAGLLPGAPSLAAGLVHNFLSTASSEGMVSWKVGPAGQRGRWMAAPFLADLAWQTYRQTLDMDFLETVEPVLSTFLKAWFSPIHDRDQDGFPEWDHLLQTGLEDNPAFTVWQPGGQGLEITSCESPALAALLYNDISAFEQISASLGRTDSHKDLLARREALQQLVDSCWDKKHSAWHYRDRDSHLSPLSKKAARLRGSGKMEEGQFFRQPARLLVRLDLHGEATRRPLVSLSGHNGNSEVSETFDRGDFQWGPEMAVATSQNLYTSLETVEVSGIYKRDQLSILSPDLSVEDISCFLPLWAGLANPAQAEGLVSDCLNDSGRFRRPFGLPASPYSVYSPAGKLSTAAMEEMDSICRAVHLPWNVLVGEGLLRYGMRQEAAHHCNRLMTAVIRSLKKQHAFASAYHAMTGAGLRDRTPLHGLASVGFFLEVLGVRILSPDRLVLSGKNPFPWPVTVKYRGLTVMRGLDRTEIFFPNGQSIFFDDPTEAAVSME